MLYSILTITIIILLILHYKDRYNSKVVIPNDDPFTIDYAKKITESTGQDVLIAKTKRELDYLKSKIKEQSEKGYYRYSIVDVFDTYEDKTILQNVEKYFNRQGFKVQVKQYGFDWLKITIEWE